MTDWPVYARIEGAIVMIGFGSIGKGTLPLIERHFSYDPARLVVIDPDDADRKILDARGIRFIHQAVTRDNYREFLTPLLTAGGRRGFCVNLSVDTSSIAIMELAREVGAFYIDTVIEPWPGFYFDTKLGPEARSNYALRETLLDARRRSPGGITAVSCCGANPGMVSWFVKQALLDIAHDLGVKASEPKSREDWGRLAMTLGVKGIHIAERDTQRARYPKPPNVFVNTWSIEGFLSEGMQPAELGWGTHENWMPPGANTRVRSWTPTPRAQYGFLVTHNESISIADYFTVREGGRVMYRPTCHYAYHPCNDAVLSLHELFGRAGVVQDDHHILDEHEIVDGIDELGVLLYRRHRRTRSAPLWPREERLLVWLSTFRGGNAAARPLPERHRPSGDFGSARRNGVGIGKSRSRHCGGRRNGFPPLPRSPAALSRPGDRNLHRLDAADGPARAVSGKHRSGRPLAVPQRAGGVSNTNVRSFAPSYLGYVQSIDSTPFFRGISFCQNGASRTSGTRLNIRPQTRWRIIYAVVLTMVIST